MPNAYSISTMKSKRAQARSIAYAADRDGDDGDDDRERGTAGSVMSVTGRPKVRLNTGKGIHNSKHHMLRPR